MRNLHIVIDAFSLHRLQSALLYVIVISLFISCRRGDSPEHEKLYGKWEIAKAERNGKETSYLRRGYFVINPNGTMTVNITGADETGPYTINNNKLVMGDKNFEFQIIKPDSMVIRFVTSPSVRFAFYMQKKHTDVQ